MQFIRITTRHPANAMRGSSVKRLRINLTHVLTFASVTATFHRIGAAKVVVGAGASRVHRKQVVDYA